MISKVRTILAKKFTFAKRPNGAVDAGRLAFYNGQAISENPYDQTNGKHAEAWVAGWREARQSREQFEAKYFRRETARRPRKSDDAEQLREERKRVEELHREAEDLLRTARADREGARRKLEEAEQVRSRAHQEWERITARENGQATDPYVVLGVHRNDSIGTIRDVYRGLVRIYHPDRHPNADELSRRQKNDFLARLNSAYRAIVERRGR